MNRTPTPAAHPPIPQLPMHQSMPALPTDTLSELACRTNARIQLHTTAEHATSQYARLRSAFYTSAGNHALPPIFKSSQTHTQTSQDRPVKGALNAYVAHPQLPMHQPLHQPVQGYAIRTCLPDQCSHPTTYHPQTHHAQICVSSQRLLHTYWQSRTSS